MTYEIYTALFSFALVSAITPGPNNVMLMASGANFGLRRSVPHMAGVDLGLPIMILPVGLGIMQVFDLWPQTMTVLRVLAVLYMLWLAWKIATASPPADARESDKPLTFFQAAAFQWVNPKAWSMSLGAITLFAAERSFAGILTVASAFALAGLISTVTWVTLGQQIGRMMHRPSLWRLFNITMATLLVASMLWSLLL